MCAERGDVLCDVCKAVLSVRHGDMDPHQEPCLSVVLLLLVQGVTAVSGMEGVGDPIASGTVPSKHE